MYVNLSRDNGRKKEKEGKNPNGRRWREMSRAVPRKCEYACFRSDQIYRKQIAYCFMSPKKERTEMNKKIICISFNSFMKKFLNNVFYEGRIK